MDLVTQISERIAALQFELSAAVPNIATILRDIHTTLKSDPTTVTLLSEDEIGILVTGLKRQTATELATATAKSKIKKASAIGLADL